MWRKPLPLSARIPREQQENRDFDLASRHAGLRAKDGLPSETLAWDGGEGGTSYVLRTSEVEILTQQGRAIGRSPDSEMAERVGFEPTVEFPLHSLSRRALSTAQTPLRVID